MNIMTLSEELYIFSARHNWTWLVQCLFWLGWINAENMFCIDDDGHSAFFYAIHYKNENLALYLINKTPNDAYWPEFPDPNHASKERTDKAYCLLSLCLESEYKPREKIFGRTFWQALKLACPHLQASLLHCLVYRSLYATGYNLTIRSASQSFEINKGQTLLARLIEGKVDDSIVGAVADFMSSAIKAIDTPINLPTSGESHQLVVVNQASLTRQLLSQQGKETLIEAFCCAVSCGRNTLVALFFDKQYVTVSGGVLNNDRRNNDEREGLVVGAATPESNRLITRPLDLAVEEKHPKIVSLLIKQGFMQNGFATMLKALKIGNDSLDKVEILTSLAQQIKSLSKNATNFWQTLTKHKNSCLSEDGSGTNVVSVEANQILKELKQAMSLPGSGSNVALKQVITEELGMPERRRSF
jgi:hypothetical protein